MTKNFWAIGTLKYRKSMKNYPISSNFGPKSKKFQVLIFYPRYNKLEWSKIPSHATELLNNSTFFYSFGWNKDDWRKSVLFRCLFFRFFGQSARSNGFLTSDRLPTKTHPRQADINKFQSPDLQHRRFFPVWGTVPYCRCMNDFRSTCTDTWKVPSGQIGSSWEWYHWIGLEKDINHFYFQFCIFEKTSKFRAASFKNASNHPTCWDHGLYGYKWRSFPPNRAPKMREN